MGKRGNLRVCDVLEVMRVVREACELGEHPHRWRGHVLERLAQILDADDAAAAFIELPDDQDLAQVDKAAHEQSHPRTGNGRRLVSAGNLPGTRMLSILVFVRDEDRERFGRRERRLLEIFHGELARLWITPVLSASAAACGTLSPRLRQVLEMLLRGADEKRIAWDLGRSRHTVHNHVRRLYLCLGVKSRAELMAIARPVANFRPRVG